MKVKYLMALGTFALLLLPVTVLAKDKDPVGPMVDEGSFGVFVSGRRVATETFSIQQQGGGQSLTTSQVKEDGGAGASQSSEMQMTSAGALVRYEWREISPGKTQLIVVPKDEFLEERVTQNPGDKPVPHPFLMPNTSAIMDNNFFIHREVLAWRYMASSCTPENNQLRCGPAQFGVIIPQESISMHYSVQPVGEEKITIKGAQRQLLRINMKSEDEDWSLWLDPQDHYKLLRVTRAGNNTEVLRD